MSQNILLFGGSSDERLVSVASAQNISKQFKFNELWFLHPTGGMSWVSPDELEKHERPFEKPFHPATLAFTHSVEEALPLLVGKILFLALHGAEGEDGVLQKLFETRKISYTGSGSQASRDCFQKSDAKKIVAKAGVQVAKQKLITRLSRASVEAEVLEFFKAIGPIALKPVASGSSFGLHMIHNEDEIAKAAIAIAASPYEVYLAEEFLHGRELTVGVVERGSIKPEALCASEVKMQKGHSFDYEGKYLGRGSTEVTPAELSAGEMKLAQELAVKAHLALGCFGYSRTDMIYTRNGPVFLETNTLPGLSKASFVPQQLKVAEISIPQFLTEQLTRAADRY